MHALVYGLAITGASTVRALRSRGFDVTAADDHVDQARTDLADALGVALLPAPRDPRAFAGQFDLVSPAPGLPERHPVIIAAREAGVPVHSEIELAYEWEQERPGGPRPILAITGTDGKTTTTELTVAILRAAGVRTASLGNTDVPLVDGLDQDLDAYVVECTSFRLAWTERFRADAAVWLNLAPDHLNWHDSMASYEAAKARIFSQQRPGDVAIGFVDDPVVKRHLRAAPGRHRTFGRSGADYRLEGPELVGPDGVIAHIDVMKRSLPHDVTNALAAAALVLETRLATPDAIATALAEFEAPPHRLEPVGAAAGVRWFNDSKATTPHAAATAVRAFESLVLIAGGSRKGVDLSPMAADAGRVRAVVAIGEAAADVRDVFEPSVRVVDAASMAEAVELAATLAQRGDAVVLSPGCASFDWYGGYPERGDDFRRLVADLVDNHESVEVTP
ncbi:MAG: UDP-N-acetylmuramoyl-L-alanine--D-glutamate ligase [Ilumatobacter sp.]|uniref:UDP-N-acetylmuramoyl-L-alanine--D-glutamate ligase n=1 Tax=Ilumatobacter sp. TaxID=1967498 RepID=UPI00263206CF|nr:UDP-N-acetylmuramoyl-L-alanine--D-glutamate ligase [Ilumatobacter sp.]MDJ0770213.1 UDP-N-acetylmuramoyl-L-alanine--D-glutamate ligase [Ilumatobacter sp.]